MIALEWDETEARVLIANVKGTQVSVDRAVSVSLEAVGQERAKETPAETLARALSEAKVPRGDAVINVGRSGTELRMLELPYVPDEELPAIVRFQAIRQFAAMTEDWKLDFVTLTKGAREGEQIKVLAAAISPQLAQQLEDGCTKSGLNLKRMLFRPFSVATLFAQAMPSETTRLIVDFTGSEADLIVLSSEGLRLSRTVRLLPKQGDAASAGIDAEQILPELRRTLMTYGNQAGAKPIEQVIVCGGEDDFDLADSLRTKLEMEVTVINPFQLVDTNANAFNEVAGDRRRFSGLIGALMTPQPCDETSIDFHNPRRPPVEGDVQRKQIFYGALAGVVVLMILGFGYFMLAREQNKLDNLIAQANSQRNLHKRTVDDINRFKQVEAFLDGAGLNWADEIDRISEKIPEEGVIIQSLSFSIDQSENSGLIRYRAVATDDDLIAQLEDALHDDSHSVTPMSNQEAEGEYEFSFAGAIEVEPPERDPKANKKSKSSESTAVSNSNRGSEASSGDEPAEDEAESNDAEEMPTELNSEDDASQTEAQTEDGEESKDDSEAAGKNEIDEEDVDEEDAEDGESDNRAKTKREVVDSGQSDAERDDS